MIRASLITKLMLAAFIANAALCPCASLAADPVSEELAVPDTADMSMHHAHGQQHQPVHGDDGTAEHLQESCHTDSPFEECGMAAGLDLDARSLESDRTDHLIGLIYSRTSTVPARETRGSAPAPRPPDRRTTGTPITTHDRLLI